VPRGGATTDCHRYAFAEIFDLTSHATNEDTNTGLQSRADLRSTQMLHAVPRRDNLTRRDDPGKFKS
jgi:hypothetical protein